MNILDHKRSLTVLGAAMTAVSGACWGYVYATKELEDSYNDRLETALDIEVEKVRNYYALMYKDQGPEAVSELPDDLVVDESPTSIPMDQLGSPEGRAAVMAAIQKLEEEEAEPEPELQTENVFDREAVPEYDEAELISERSPEKPYVISKEEFFRNDAHYEEYNLTFFEGDGVLLDDQDNAIPDTEQVVGDVNLQRFGVMSDDNNVVYVQNDASEVIFAITRSFGTATEALFGVEDEDTALEHSSMKRRRPRREDE